MISITSRTHHTAPILVSALALGLILSSCSSTESSSTTSQSNSSTVSSTNSKANTATSTNEESTTRGTVQATAKAAQAFLETLTDEQKATVLKGYNDEDKSITWSNFPVTFVERAGLNLKDLTEEQHTAALNVLKALLNDETYTTISNIMAGDEYLLKNSSTVEESFGQYYIAFYGDPSDNSAWTLQFGGHHLGINATMDTDSLTFAPTHLGTQPAEWVNEQGETIKTMDKIYTTAFDFYNSLSTEQKSKLYQGKEVATMVCAPGDSCDYPTGTGLKGSDLDDEQKDLLIDLIANWAGMADEETTTKQLNAIRDSLDNTYVNWSGATTYDTSKGNGIYFQISGPKVYIEFASQKGSAGSDVEGVITAGWGHVHTIYRDPSNDYANSVEQQESNGPQGESPQEGAPQGGSPQEGAPQRGSSQSEGSGDLGRPSNRHNGSTGA